MLKALYILNAQACDDIYGPAQREAIGKAVEVMAPPMTREQAAAQPALLAQADVIFSGWGAPVMDDAFLAAAGRLRAVFYGAGSIRGIVTDAFWDRSIVITSAWAANAVPVCEYTLSQILWCLKGGWHYVLEGKRQGRVMPRVATAGAFGSTVGIISLGMIGRGVCRLLKNFDVNVVAYDPFATPSLAADLNVKLVGLDELFALSDVVSLHTPKLPETLGMITGKHIESMKRGATFINTSRGAVVREAEMIDVLARRSDLYAVLDVLTNESTPDSRLLTLPNVVLTPHIAGSMGRECNRMGQYMVDELNRYLAGEPLKYAVDRQAAQKMA